ncbi:MAG: pyrroline-5-carboxylate reductase [Planctomycetota bacterium]|nr:pyrroline-5-carboxylate reductase [Planctomycetota bacterium]
MPKGREQVGFIGCGEMGSMILSAALEAGVLEASQTQVAERDTSRRNRIASLGVNTVDSPTSLDWCDRLIMAVRPQQFNEATNALGCSDQARLVVSIMAGINSASIKQALGTATRVICVMPNAPVRVHAGMSILMPGEDTTSSDITFAESLFGPLGATAQLPESALWPVTAVSGSGPGYVALFAEAMTEAAIKFGIEPDVAATLVAHTIAGTGRMLVDTGIPAADLRASVATPGGTTEAGIEAMVDRNITQLIQAGIQAAHDRGESLSKHG